MQVSRALVLTGGLILCIGAPLPWISVPVLFSVHGPLEGIKIGWEDKGIITGCIGLILLFIEFFNKGKNGKIFSFPGVILVVLASLVLVGCFKRVLEIHPSAGFFAGTDVGLYVTLLGAILALVGGLNRIQVLYKPLNEASI